MNPVYGLPKLILWNGYITKIDLHIECRLFQNSNGAVHRNSVKKSQKFIWKHKRPYVDRIMLEAPQYLNPKLSYRAMVTKQHASSKKVGTPISGLEQKTQKQTYINNLWQGCQNI